MTFTQNCKICGAPTKNLYTNMFDERHGYPQFFSIVQCLYCGYCRVEPSLERGELQGVYSKYYPKHILTVDSVEPELKKQLAKSRFGVWLTGSGIECHYYIQPGARVLDVGCGNCLSLLMTKELGGSDCVGTEVDENVVGVARAFNLDVHIGQLADLPEEKGTFDFILAQQVLEHDPQPEDFLREMTQRLNKNGKIIVSFPNVNALYRYVFRRKWLHWHVPYHINHFSRKSVEILAKRCGLRIQQLKTVTPNDWTVYQLNMYRTTARFGEKVPFWNSGTPSNVHEDQPIISSQTPSTFPGSIVKMLKQGIKHSGICIANRLLDAMGLGESFVVTLTR